MQKQKLYYAVKTAHCIAGFLTGIENVIVKVVVN